MAARRSNRAQIEIAAVDKVAAPIRRINRKIESMTEPIRRVRRSMRALAREAKLDSLARGLGRVGRGMRHLAFAGAAAVAGLGVMVSRQVDRADEIGKFARQVDLSAESLQRWEFAADRVGIGSEKFRQSVGALSKRVGELKAGTGALNTLLNKVDPGFARRLKATQNTEEALELVIGRLRTLKDPAHQAALSASAFSRAGLEMARIALEDELAFKKLMDRADELGFVLSTAATQEAEKTKDRLTDLKAAVTGLASQVAVQLMPWVQKMATAMTDWVVANKEWLQTDMAAGVKELFGQMLAFGRWVGQTAPKVAGMVEAIGGLRNLAIVVGGVLAVALLAPLLAILTTIGAIPAAIAATVAAVGALAAGGFFEGEIGPQLAGGPQGEAAAFAPAAAQIGGELGIRISADRGLSAQVGGEDLEGLSILDPDLGLSLAGF